MDRRTVLLGGMAAAQPPARIAVALVSEPGGPHLAIYRDSLKAASGVESVAEASAGDRATLRRSALAVVALPAHRAPDAIRAALDSGCHVLAEKPACTGAEDFAKLAEIAAQRRRHLMLAFASRLYPASLRAASLIRGGMLGKPYSAEMRFVADQTRLASRAYQQSWFARRDQAGGGHLIWLGIHYLDLLQHLTGQRIDRVAALTANVGGQPADVEDAEAVSFRTAGGLVGTFTGGYFLDRGYHNEISLWGSLGWMRFNPSASLLEWQSRAAGAPSGPQRTDCGPAAGYQPFVQSAIDAARGAAPPPVTAAECLQALRVVFACYRSADTGIAQPV